MITDWYKNRILAPHIHACMNKDVLAEDRRYTVSGASGIVLEIGFGSGINIPFYSPAVQKLYALEPFETLYAKAMPLLESARFPVEHLATSAEQIPLPSNSVDYVVSTWTLCSVTDPHKALQEIERVLKPGGTYLFNEHGRSNKALWAGIQDVLSPVTALFDGNCHLNRNIEEILKQSHLHVVTLEKIPEPDHPLDFGYRGQARKGYS